MSAARVRALQNHYLRATGVGASMHDHIQFVATDDIGKWYFIMGVRADVTDDEIAAARENNKPVRGEFSGEQNEFIGGQFIGILRATSKYPFGPPDAEMLTPTGIFPLNSPDFCIDIGKYHANQYPPTLGLDGFAGMIWAGFINWRELGSGIALFPHGNPKKDLSIISNRSLSSRSYNLKHHKEILQMFIDAAAEKIAEPVPAPAPADIADAVVLSAKEIRKLKMAEEAKARRAKAAEEKKNE